jgi:uncharacterized protein (DUF433 family)
MSLTLEPQFVPPVTTPEGVMRVSGTRVTPDTVVGAFLDGATPETIAQQYPSLPLADVHAVIAYYLRHRADVNAYLAAGQVSADKVRRDTEAQWGPTEVQARLLARAPSSGNGA